MMENMEKNRPVEEKNAFGRESTYIVASFN
jgi:hypothetical protein